MMKRSVIPLFVCVVLALPALSSAQVCFKIQSGTISDVKGNPVTVGYDK